MAHSKQLSLLYLALTRMATAVENGANHVNGGKPAQMSKSMLKRQKRKAKKQQEKTQVEPDVPVKESQRTPASAKKESNDLLEDIAMPVDDPQFAAFAHVFERFNPTVDPEQEAAAKEKEKGEVLYNEDMALDSEEDDEDEAEALSKTQARKQSRMSVAELKQKVKKPEVVEWWDVASADPLLLVQMKSTRNAVPIPQHWSQKRDYLAGKKGIEKPPFELPAYIADTGVATQREAVLEKEQDQKLRQKMRERVQPKMGKISIDYQRLHDAFFRYQTKPRMTKYGEIYYEGKEFETRLKEKKPGDLSEELKEALNIPPLAPPPWLISMQRYGPPPSYPNLKIPGLNSPIPEGAMWGFHPGGWGKPPVDEHGRPLYGDVFGVAPQQHPSYEQYGEPVEKTLWGELEPDKDEDEEEEYEDEGDDEEDEEEPQEEEVEESTLADGLATPGGMETPSGMQSVPSGLETPDYIQLRKDKAAARAAPPPVPDSNGPKQLYTVIPERQTKVQGFMGSQHGYDLSNSARPPILGEESRGSKRKQAGEYDVALDPEEMEGLNQDALRAKYEQQHQAQQQSIQKEDLSDLVVEHAQKQAKRQKTKAEDKDKKKKDKFKF